ncbi:MAG: hypothetical protein AB1Z65_09690, partial [Candidatus Sulfomarinibacteraceae bacterium]
PDGEPEGHNAVARPGERQKSMGSGRCSLSLSLPLLAVRCPGSPPRSLSLVPDADRCRRR